MHKEIRKQMVLRRKNFLPSVIVTFLLVLSLIAIIYFTDPNASFFVFLFFINLFALFVFFFSLVLGNSKRGTIISICLTLFSILRYFGVGNILNAVLLAGLGIIAIIYNERTSKTGH